MEVNVVVSMDDKEVRDAILDAAKFKLGSKDCQGSSSIRILGSESDVQAEVKFQYKKT